MVTVAQTATPDAPTHATTPVAAHEKHIILYDDRCPMCTFQERLLSRLDLGHRFEFVGLNGERARAVAPNLDLETMRAAMHVLTRDGNVHRGARAIRFISARMVLLWPVGVLLWIPGAIFLAEVLYKGVAKNRYVISRLFGCKTACEILPPKSN